MGKSKFKHTHTQQIKVNERFFRMEFVFPICLPLGPWCPIVLLEGMNLSQSKEAS